MVKIQDLQFKYGGQKKNALMGLNFSIEKGEIFGFIGPSGAGKSTTQKIMIGLLKGYTGTVCIAGNELSSITPDYYEKVGIAFEVPNLYSKFTALENLKFFKSIYSGETEDPYSLLDAVGLKGDAHTKVSKFSKGMKTRLNFCRALLNKPDIIFLDEPTSGLDPVNTRKVKDIILKMKSEGRTIFLTTHNMAVAEDVCDRVAFIVDGQIKLIGSPTQLKLDMGKKVIQVEYKESSKTEMKEFQLKDIGSNEEFIKFLREKDILTIHTQEATLDDIFIKVTGRSLA